MKKLQITLTPEVHTILEERGGRLGLDVTRYAKLLLHREAMTVVECQDELHLTPKGARAVAQAMKEYREGKAIRVDSVLDLLK